MIKIMPKVIVLLELFADGEELSVKEVIRRSGLNQSNVSHLLKSLCEEKILERVGYGKYRRAERLVRLCTGGNPWQELLSKAERCADNLMSWLDELVVVGMRDRDRRLTLVKRRPIKNLQVEMGPSRTYPANWYETASGRILLAHAPEETVRRIVTRCGLPERKVWREATSLPKLEAELARIRKQGFAAIDVDELIHVLGVPVRDASGEFLLSLSAAYPVFSCRKKEEEIIRHMQELASTLEEELRIGGIRIVELKKRTFEADCDNTKSGEKKP